VGYDRFQGGAPMYGSLRVVGNPVGSPEEALAY
jgi:hypothetical protein